MRICPKCRTSYPDRARATCTNDGARLLDMHEYDRLLTDPLIGKTVAGRFHVIERIGSGGMGTVYRAEQAGLGRQVALKVLKGELISDRDTVTRFHREAKAMSLLVHPNTVRVFDFGEDEAEGHLFLAMELLEGELLTSWVEREGTPPIAEAVEVIRQILRSLAEAHQKGIIHRDLKPDNIFLTRVEGQSRPVVKVLDFGIAKAFRDDRKIDQLETQAGTVFGTPRYMSPEQAQGKTLDHRSDLYTVGVLLYQLLTGRPPFLDDDAVVVMAKHIRETPAAPRTIVPDHPIPRSLERCLMRALAKEPDDRIDNADAFEARLAACLPDVEAEARGSASTLGALRVPIAIGGGIVALAIVAAIAVIAGGADDDPPADLVPIATTPLVAPVEPLPAPPAMTAVTLASEPSGAEIWRGDERIGATPHTFDLASGDALALTLRAEGRVPADVELTVAAAPLHTVALRAEEERSAEATSSAPPRARNERPEDPAPDPEVPATQEPDPYERFE